MPEFLQVQIEFPQDESQKDLTPQTLYNSIRSVFLEAGVAEDVVSAGIDPVRLEDATHLGIDPASATIFVALIGMSVELIKLGFELEKQGREEAQKTAGKTPDDTERRLLEQFVGKILLDRLLEQHNIRSTSVCLKIEER